MRAGIGYDVHKLTQGRRLVLGGVVIPSEKGLDGHSDADVLVHAIMDAMLGAAALGDIGQHFPDTDPHYQGADSLRLMEHCTVLLKKQGFAVHNIDAIICAQAPKMAPHIAAMRANIAAACDVSLGAVSVKATTTEHLGFVGDGSGMSAYAVCTLEETHA